MAYIPMVQETIRFINTQFNKNDLKSYQQLIILFGNLFANEKEFLKDPSNRMGLSHFVENFLRVNGFQAIVTIKDLNLIFHAKTEYDINDIELYKVFFVLIYEELSSNDPDISEMIKEAVFKLIDLINNNQLINKIEEDDNKINEPNIFIKHIMKQKQNNKEIKTSSSNFVIHKKDYLFEYIKNKNLLPYKCSICGISEWQEEPLKLELDSLDGVYNNLNLNNLRFLCPNCFSQVGRV